VVTAAPPSSADPILEDIETHLGANVEWLEVSELFLMQHESCVDGRDSHGVLGTPGGDTGELVLALSAVESVAKRPLLDRQIDRVVSAELGALNDFYLHTDTHALKHLREELSKDPSTAAYAKKLLRKLPPPPKAIREKVIEHLVEARNVGCGHLKLMLQHGHDYGVRPGLVRAVLRSIYRRYFDGHPAVSFTVLDGGHGEEAVVQIKVPEPVRSSALVPMVTPHRLGTQVFVQHPQVADFVRVTEVKVLLKEAPWLIRLDVTQPLILARMRELADKQLDQTLRRLAAGLPIYVVDFAPDRTYAVHKVGAVPKPPAASKDHTH